MRMVQRDAGAVEERAVEPPAGLRVAVARRVAVTRVAEDGMADGREVASDLVRPALIGADHGERVAAEDALAAIAGARVERAAALVERARDRSLLAQDAAHEREVLLLRLGRAERGGPRRDRTRRAREDADAARAHVEPVHGR